MRFSSKMKQHFLFGPMMSLTPLRCLPGVLEPVYSFSAISTCLQWKEFIISPLSLKKKDPPKTPKNNKRATINLQTTPPQSKTTHTKKTPNPSFLLWMWFLIIFFKLKLVFPVKRNFQHFVLSTMSRFFYSQLQFSVTKHQSRLFKRLQSSAPVVP